MTLLSFWGKARRPTQQVTSFLATLANDWSPHSIADVARNESQRSLRPKDPPQNSVRRSTIAESHICILFLHTRKLCCNPAVIVLRSSAV